MTARRRDPHRAAAPQARREPPASGRALRVGVLSDTHGLMRLDALTALLGSDLLLHAGDIGAAAVLEALQAIAPLVAIRGNNDTQPWAADLPETAVHDTGAVRIFITHNRAQLALDPRAAGFQVVVSGHSHQPLIEQRDGVLYVNPGSCGPRRFSLPVTVALLTIRGARVEAKIVDLMAAGG